VFRRLDDDFYVADIDTLLVMMTDSSDVRIADYMMRESIRLVMQHRCGILDDAQLITATNLLGMLIVNKAEAQNIDLDWGKLGYTPQNNMGVKDRLAAPWLPTAVEKRKKPKNYRFPPKNPQSKESSALFLVEHVTQYAKIHTGERKWREWVTQFFGNQARYGRAIDVLMDDPAVALAWPNFKLMCMWKDTPMKGKKGISQFHGVATADLNLDWIFFTREVFALANCFATPCDVSDAGIERALRECLPHRFRQGMTAVDWRVFARLRMRNIDIVLGWWDSFKRGFSPWFCNDGNHAYMASTPNISIEQQNLNGKLKGETMMELFNFVGSCKWEFAMDFLVSNVTKWAQDPNVTNLPFIFNLLIKDCTIVVKFLDGLFDETLPTYLDGYGFAGGLKTDTRPGTSVKQCFDNLLDEFYALLGLIRGECTKEEVLCAMVAHKMLPMGSWYDYVHAHENRSYISADSIPRKHFKKHFGSIWNLISTLAFGFEMRTNGKLAWHNFQMLLLNGEIIEKPNGIWGYRDLTMNSDTETNETSRVSTVHQLFDKIEEIRDAAHLDFRELPQFSTNLITPMDGTFLWPYAIRNDHQILSWKILAPCDWRKNGRRFSNSVQGALAWWTLMFSTMIIMGREMVLEEPLCTCSEEEITDHFTQALLDCPEVCFSHIRCQGFPQNMFRFQLLFFLVTFRILTA